LFEYGEFRSKKETIYPTNFTFAKYGHHRPTKGLKVACEDFYKTQPQMNDLLEYDFVIASELYWNSNHDKWSRIEGTTNFYLKIDNTTDTLKPNGK
jgi:hypothetical protein